MVEVAAGSGVSAGDGTTVGGVLVTESLKPALAPTGVNSTGTRRRAAGGGTVAGDGSAAGGEVATVTALKTRDTGPALASVGADEVAKETVTEANTTPSIAPTRVQTLSRVASTTIGMTPAAAPTAATWTQPIVVKAGDGTVAGDGTAAGARDKRSAQRLRLISLPTLRLLQSYHNGSGRVLRVTVLSPVAALAQVRLMAHIQSLSAQRRPHWPPPASPQTTGSSRSL